MFTRIFALFALVFALFVTQTRATTVTCYGVFSESEVLSCSNQFMPGTTTGVYDFTGTGDGKLVVHFDTVLDNFSLTVSVNHTIDPIDFTVFPPGTACVPYAFNGGLCDQYDFSGTVGRPNMVPLKNVDYKGLITLTLSYLNSLAFQIHTPAFGHAPGDIMTFTEDILTSYSSFPVTPPGCGTSCGVGFAPTTPGTLTTPAAPTTPGDPTMKGTTPGLSSVIALDEPGPNDAFCLVSPQPLATFEVGDEIEVAFRLTPFGSDCTSNHGNSIRDKDTRLSVVDSQGNFVAIRDHEGGNKFQFDKDDGVNERDLNTEGLVPGVYTVTLFSDEFSPYSFTFTLTACTDEHCTD